MELLIVQLRLIGYVQNELPCFMLKESKSYIYCMLIIVLARRFSSTICLNSSQCIINSLGYLLIAIYLILNECIYKSYLDLLNAELIVLITICNLQLTVRSFLFKMVASLILTSKHFYSSLKLHAKSDRVSFTHMPPCQKLFCKYL